MSRIDIATAKVAWMGIQMSCERGSKTGRERATHTSRYAWLSDGVLGVQSVVDDERESCDKVDSSLCRNFSGEYEGDREYGRWRRMDIFKVVSFV